MKYFDLHCDTALALLYAKSSLLSNEHHVSIEKAKTFEKYAQSFAFFALSKLNDDEAYDKFVAMNNSLTEETKKNHTEAVIVKNSKEYAENASNGKMIILPAVEDARILSGDLEKIKALKEAGVWYLTMLWGGDTVIGGSHNTDNGLTQFGKDTVRAAFANGIVPDISHASEKSATDIIAIAEEFEKPVIASHSNSYSVYSHSRNLRDYHLKKLLALGGIIGISLCDSHLADKPAKQTCMDDVIRHIEYYLEFGCENSLCIGADWDGTTLPCDMHDIRDAAKLYEELLRRNYSVELLDKIFYYNAYNFYMNNL